MSPKYIWLTLTLVLGCAFAEKFSYTGYKLYQLFPETQEQADLIAELEHDPEFDLWSRVRQEGVKVALGPSVLEKFEIVFKLFKIRFEIVNHNLQDLFDDEERQMKRREIGSSKNIHGKYARHGEHMSWIQDKAEENPSFVSTYVPGKSVEGRDLRVIRIGAPQAKRKIWIDCGIHAREWVSPSTCNWIAHKLIEEYNKDLASTVDLLNHYEFHIMPIMNPDGYEFTHASTRLWRKNRKVNPGSACIGVDLNRNFGYKWSTGGSSPLPCSDTYAGPSADSEVETKAVQTAINAHLGEWDVFLTIHSYGKWLFTPFGYTGAILPNEFQSQNASAAVSVKALQNVNNETGWVTGSSSQILYVASGGSEDWAYGIANIIYSYCFELRPGQTGPDSNFGFTLPEDRAPLAGEETYQGIKALVNDIRAKLPKF